jgi:hypothetical protein
MCFLWGWSNSWPFSMIYYKHPVWMSKYNRLIRSQFFCANSVTVDNKSVAEVQKGLCNVCQNTQGLLIIQEFNILGGKRGAGDGSVMICGYCATFIHAVWFNMNCLVCFLHLNLFFSSVSYLFMYLLIDINYTPTFLHMIFFDFLLHLFMYIRILFIYLIQII